MRLNDEDKIDAILRAIEAADGVPIPFNLCRRISGVYQDLKAWNESVVREP